MDYAILPSVSYNPDHGLQYGALANLYYYGDSSIYPNFLYNLYIFAARTTRNEYTYHLFFDSKYIFSGNIRVTANFLFRKNKYEQFYGFNGYNSDYQKNFEDPSKKDFISRHYYDQQKKLFNFVIDVQGNLPMPHFRYDLGMGYYNIVTKPVQRDGKVYPELSLFEKYISNAVIPPGQQNGGITTYLKTALIYDSRDNESVPTRGIWAEAIYCNASEIFNNEYPYAQFAVLYRQYLKLSKSFVFAYRLAYQSQLNGQIPYYMLPYLLSTYWTVDALGGVKTIRGVLNHRIQGSGYLMANFELRYVLLNTILLKRNLSIALNSFTDMGRVSKMYKISTNLKYDAFDYRPDQEKMHYSVGGGIRFIVNYNLIASLDCGQPLNKQDGRTAVYLDLDYLF